MDDVMSSLQGMTTVDEPKPPTDFDPWSPEAFDDLQRPRSTRPSVKPVGSTGVQSNGSDFSGRFYAASQHGSPGDPEGPPQLSNFVQRMESRLKRMQDEKTGSSAEDFHQRDHSQPPPMVPAKDSPWNSRPVSSMGSSHRPVMDKRKSAYELGRTFTIKSNTTNSSSGVQSNATYSSSTATSMTGQSVFSAGEMSATSAGSLARRNQKLDSINERSRAAAGLRPQTPLTTMSRESGQEPWHGAQSAVGGGENRSTVVGLGGLTTPKVKKQGFLKKLLDGSKTVAASARSSIAVSQSGSAPTSPTKARLNHGMTGMVAGGVGSLSSYGPDADGLRGSSGNSGRPGETDWVNVRRDVNRSNTPGPMELQERAERCQMFDYPVIYPIQELHETVEGDEAADGYPVPEPFQLSNPSFTGVDKAARFITSLPPMITPASLAQGYVCRPHRSDVQRLRAIFTWASERIAWDEDFDGEIDLRRVIQTKRGCSHEVAMLVYEMCAAIGIHAEVIRGYLKIPGEDTTLDAALKRPNHYWNAVVVDHEWRMLDCSISSPTNPKRALFSSINAAVAEPFYFLSRPSEICYTHIPILPEHQHLVPSLPHDTLLALPCALPPYFRQRCHLAEYNTSLTRLEGLEMAVLNVDVPPDIELVAEIETQAYLRDSDGDIYENGDSVDRKRALSQASWCAISPGGGGTNHPPTAISPITSSPFTANMTAASVLTKRYTIKALLPPGESSGTLKIYAGHRGLMHSSKDITHPLALTVPIYHQSSSSSATSSTSPSAATGHPPNDNPPYDFLTRHPTPHAMRQDLYVVRPQCRRLVVGETFVFCVRQHSASAGGQEVDDGGLPGQSVGSGANNNSSTLSLHHGPARPTSAMSMMSSTLSGGGGGSESSGSGGDIISYNHHNGSSIYPSSSSATAAAAANNNNNNNNNNGGGGTSTSSRLIKDFKPAKLAVQSPSGKIIRLVRQPDNNNNNNNDNNTALELPPGRRQAGVVVPSVGSSSSSSLAAERGPGAAKVHQQGSSVWETTLKIQERGVWRGLVLADRSARWCVWGEWESCV